MNIPSDPPTRQSILQRLADITRMRRGTLSEQYVQRPSPDGKGSVRHGPYFKYQVWQDGGNHTRGVPASEAAVLREDIENYRIFKQLTGQLADLTIEQTIALRNTEADATAGIAEKKTSKPNASPKNTAKRKPFSPKPAKKSPRGKNSTS